MRKIRPSLLAVLTLLVLACGAWSAASAQVNGAVIQFTEFSGTISDTINTECLGDMTVNLAFKGFVKVVATPTTVNTIMHELSLGSGVTASGVVFESVASTHQSTRTAGLSDSYEDTVTVKMQEVTQGSAPNFSITMRTHITVTPGGAVTSSFESIDTECRAPQQ